MFKSIKSWPPVAPALHVFPFLKRFGHTIRPRRNARAVPGVKDAGWSVRKTSLRSLYDDLGVCVYAGASASQLERMGNLLKTITADGRSPLDFNSMSRLEGSNFNKNGEIKGEDGTNERRRDSADKYVKYRLQTEDRHIDQHWRTEHGYVSLEGIHELAMKAASKWMDEAKSAAQEKLPELGVTHFVPKVGYCRRALFNKGIMHPTINGRRRLNVDAHCWIHRTRGVFHIFVDLSTIGAFDCVGQLMLEVHVVAGEAQDFLYNYDKLAAILKEAPSLPLATYEELVAVTDTVYELERETWADRVDQKRYPSAVSIRASRSLSKAEEAEQPPLERVPIDQVSLDAETRIPDERRD